MEPTLSTRKAAEYLQVDESTIKRWADKGLLKCSKTAGGHRKFSISALKASANKLGIVNSYFEVAGQKSPDLKSSGENAHSKFGSMLIAGDAQAAYNLLLSKYMNDIPLETIFDSIVAPAMNEIGKKWKCGELGIEEEHISSNTLKSVLYRVESIVTANRSSKSKSKGKVILAGLEDEQHEIGLHCVRIFFRSLGWDVVYPGCGLPVKSLLALVSKEKPKLVCITSSSSRPETKLKTGIDKLSKQLSSSKTILIVGGNTNNIKGNGIHTMKKISDLKEFLTVIT